MVDHFAMGLTHLLLAIAAWRLVMRADLDRDPPAGEGASPQDRPKDGRPGADRP